ncbi:hypothetical protein [Arthrobacter sp. OV608]|uniref:hypothetical protein n=1 Tax=Arthrobacter sp. OV608 TaxID=1882768 RepID=UPI0008D8AC5B|nr:hypothetical protein [Arthrobacter sp. OV608]SER33500.1 hypothetical protein SAMN05444745_1383 [Arthrobacter sp. OV608]
MFTRPAWSVIEVRVPTREQEDLRDLSPLRATAAKNPAHARHHVNAILLRHGIRYPEETKWAWLHRQHFDFPVLQFTFETDVEQAELLAEQIKRIDQRVAQVAKTFEYTPVIEALMLPAWHPGHHRVRTRRGDRDPTRFSGASIGSYSAWYPANSPPAYPCTRDRSPRQLDLVAPAARIQTLEGNQRLHRKWEAFDARKKRSVTANTAIARERAGWCWCLAAPLQHSEHGQRQRMNAV